MTIRIARRWLLVFIAFAAALSSSVAAFAQEGDTGPSTPPSPAAAAPIYRDRCANCHGALGQGDGMQAAQANISIPDLTDPALLRETTPARWFEIISSGVDGKMPAFGDASSNPLQQTERWDLVFFLYTLGTPQAQVLMGQALYERDCLECHGPDGTGGVDGAPGFVDLTRMANLSQTDLFAAIQDHDLGLGDVEIWTLADYVRTYSYDYVPPSTANASTQADSAIATNPFSGGEGTIRGQVINGTPGAALPIGLVVQLRAFDMNAEFIDAITTTVTSDGSFRFDGIDPAAPVQLEPLVAYQGVPYFGDLEAAITLSPAQPEADANITVYETTEDHSAIRIEWLHVVFDLEPSQVQVLELYILSNDGDRTYVGTLEEGTLPLTLPPGTLGFQPGGDPGRYLTLADGLADTIPIPPGQSTAESVLIYNLAYDGELELSRPMPYDTSRVSVFVPADAGIEVVGDQLRASGPIDAQGTTLDMYVAEDLAAGDRLTLRLSGEPQASSGIAAASAHQSPGPNQSQGVAIGVIALIGAVALAYLYWQGALRFELRPSTPDRRSALLSAIADLDDDYESGRMNEERYRTKRAELKEELIELMEAD